MASVQNCSLLQKDSTDEPNGLHARPYWIAPNASCPDMVGWPLVARGSRGSQPGKNLPHRYEKGCNVEKAISDACHAWRSRMTTPHSNQWSGVDLVSVSMLVAYFDCAQASLPLLYR